MSSMRLHVALNTHNAPFPRSLGQNFLTDDSILLNIVKQSGVKPGDLVLEVRAAGASEGTVARNNDPQQIAFAHILPSCYISLLPASPPYLPMLLRTCEPRSPSPTLPPSSPVHGMDAQIGPGTGNLTKHLLERGALVTAVEKDDTLFERLSEEYKEVRNCVFVFVCVVCVLCVVCDLL